MRVNQITCPKCGATIKSKAGIPVGSSISCPKCSRRFTVEATDELDLVEDAEEVEDTPPPRKKGPPPTPARNRLADEDDEDDDPPPRRKKPGSVKAKKGRPRDDDEDDDRPRKKKGKRRDADDEPDSLYLRLRRNVLVRVITLVVLLGVLAVLGYLLYQKKQAERELENAARSSTGYAWTPDSGRSASTSGPRWGRV